MKLIILLLTLPLLLRAQPPIPQAVVDAVNCRLNLSIDSADAERFNASRNSENGTAFLVKDKTTNSIYLVTAAHVVASNGMIGLYKNGEPITIALKNWTWDSGKDFAICEVKQQDFPANLRPIPFNDLADLQLNEATYIPTDTSIDVGFLQDTNSTSEGNIIAYHLLKCTNKVEKGQSGSPIFNAKGKVIGILLRKDEAGGCFALDRRRFVELIYQLQGQGKANRIYTGLVFAADAKGEHPYIADYIPNSPAAAARSIDIYIGKAILKINAKPVHNLQDIYQILEDTPEKSMFFFLKCANIEDMLGLDIVHSGNAEQQQIADYFCQKYLKPIASPPISFVKINQVDSQYEILEKWQLGGLVRTFAWHNSLGFYDKNNTACLPVNALGLEKVLIF